MGRRRQDLSGVGVSWRSHELSNEPSSSIKCGEFVDELRNSSSCNKHSLLLGIRFVCQLLSCFLPCIACFSLVDFVNSQSFENEWVWVFACLLFNAKIPRKVSQPSKQFLFISKSKFRLLSKQHKNRILVAREGISPRRAFLADRLLAIHGSPETTFAMPVIWREIERPFSRSSWVFRYSGRIFYAEPNAILSRNIGAEAGFRCDQAALIGGGGGTIFDWHEIGGWETYFMFIFGFYF
jgi:hypothetical protein